MSERLSSVEIEDVLSSIRRLVSDDLRPGAKTAAAAVPAAEAAPAADKLILTPALRIAPEPEGAATPATQGETPEAPAAFQSVRRGAGRVDAVMGEVARGLDEGEADPEIAPGASGRHDWFEFGAAAATPPATPEGVAQEASAEEAEVWAVPGDPEVIAPPEAQDEDGAAGDWAVESPVHDADGAEEAMPDMQEPAETVADVVEPPLTGQGWADAAEAEIRRELEAEAVAVEESVFARFDAADHDDRAFDEEMLRDLVRDIIREELQGALGERITRNVRKLVRSEIARALAVRDFE